ncbi:hypothetical protein Zmor_023382 [Zophobas morio]|uniref:Protein quiver n=1 Tax=Zophobas morio TaxID=2755281 RepID=A0AA38HZS2_9CUCU|nr:hypothetical protein Zmor_023382 [Zophobas morio]
MKAILVLAVLCLAICETFADDTLECYQCNPVTSECEVGKADSIKCGKTNASKCLKQIRKGTSDETKAIRKCVVPDGSGNVACPNGFDCHVCDSDMCNTGSVTKVTWVSVIGVFLAVLHMY